MVEISFLKLLICNSLQSFTGLPNDLVRKLKMVRPHAIGPQPSQFPRRTHFLGEASLAGFVRNRHPHTIHTRPVSNETSTPFAAMLLSVGRRAGWDPSEVAKNAQISPLQLMTLG